MSLKLGTVDIAGFTKNTIVTGFNTFDCKWSDHLINDIQWLRADTFSWQSGNVYTTAYNKLVSEYSTGTTETVGGITYKRTTNGFKIADATQEAAIAAKYEADGIAWFYILDTTNQRFKLPRTKFGFEGLRTSVGDDIAESLPNITGGFGCGIWGSTTTGTGVFADTTSVYQGTLGSNYSAFYLNGVDFKASNSSSTYQTDAPVQERATQMYLYFYVGEYSRTALEQTAGITSEQLNGKVDKSSLQDCRVVVEVSSKSILPSWYRVYSDGWCEQGGVVTTNGSGDTDVVTTFTKQFADTNYTIQTQVLNLSSTTGITFDMLRVYNKTANSFTTRVNSLWPKSWQASGYIS